MTTMLVKYARAPLFVGFSLMLLAGCDRGTNADLPASQVSGVNTLPEQAAIPLPDLQLVGFDERPVSQRTTDRAESVGDLVSALPP